ncbi:MBL fold metallo-hydrolase [Phaeospirillum tilakii]|uniref:MBL fold metallo-hydrolase n=1 Tax=Phaeospirillum tilakii TaxID=741673 RepID=A0ABW5CC20_9PROT
MTYQHLGDFGDLSLAVVVTSPPWYENSYLVLHRPSGALALVDPGDDAARLREAVAALGGRPAAILLTHGHPDHLGAAAAMETEYDIPTRAHLGEKTVIAAAGDLSRAFTGQPLTVPARLDLFEPPVALDLGGAPIRVIATPGHSPGGVCYDFGAFVLTGDTLFRGGVGRTDLPGGSEQQLWDSIERLLAGLADEVWLFSGHGPGWTAAEARRWWALAG